MWLSDTAVQRPVFATVISLILIAFGVLAFQNLPTREYPDIVPPIISIDTNYFGASANVVESRITQLLEGQISGIQGIKSINSRSLDGRSSISIEFDLDVELDQAANDVRDRISRAARALPDGVDLPSISKQDSDARAIMYLSLTSDDMSAMELNDYAQRYIVDRFNVIPGVSRMDVRGSGRPSMRIWIDRLALAARRLTIGDVEDALRRQNLELPAGKLESTSREFQVRLASLYQTPEDFRELVIARGEDGYLVRLGEIARVELGPENVRNVFRANAANTVALGVVKQSTANTVEVLDAVKATVVAVNEDLPGSMELIPSSDDSIYIRAAIEAVYYTIAVTTLLVSAVILLFLGSFRAMLIPAVTIPICLIAAFIALGTFELSLNLITLLALVLSIGLVVDDAIVVVENVHRRMEKGEPPLLAAFRGARQVGFAVIATTLVLVAVFTPILFLDDNLGQLFGELAVTVSAAMIFSTILALSLTPVMCSKLLKTKSKPGAISGAIDRGFAKLTQWYASSLERSLALPWVGILVAGGVIGAAWVLFNQIDQEYAPKEDQGFFLASFTAAEGTSFERMAAFVDEIEAPMLKEIESGNLQRALVRIPGWRGGSGSNSAIVVATLSPDRPETFLTEQYMRELTTAWNDVPGLQVFTFMRSGLSRGGGGQPVQIVLGGPSYEELAQWRDTILAKAAENPRLMRVQTDFDDTQPQIAVSIDRNRAASLGVSLQTVGTTLESLMAEKRVATYVVDGEEYEIIMQAQPEQRRQISDLQNIFVRSSTSGELIPLASVVKIEQRSGASRLNRYNRLRSVTISANLAPGYSLAEALTYLENIISSELPAAVQVDYKGESLEFKEASGAIFFTFGIALLVVFLVLAAQFESFVHPFVIMVSVPLAVAGGLFGLWVTNTPFNIFSQIGLIILIGIATKNGILIVEFINQVRETGEAFEKSIIEAAKIRLRPVLMTTISTTAGAIPLIVASGAGALSRNNLGIVVFFGVLLSAIMTLYIVPAFYKVFARGTRSRNAMTDKLKALQAQA